MLRGRHASWGCRPQKRGQPASLRLGADSQGSTGNGGVGQGQEKEGSIACTYCHRHRVCRGLPERRGHASSCHLQSHGPGETLGDHDACYSDNRHSP